MGTDIRNVDTNLQVPTRKTANRQAIVNVATTRRVNAQYQVAFTQVTPTCVYSR